MAFGLPSTFSQYIPLNNLSRLQLIFIAIEVFKKLKWDLTQINENGLKAQSKNDLNTWNETIVITLEDHDPFIESFSNGNQIYDRGRNQKNIDTFLDLFYEVTRNKKYKDQLKLAFIWFLGNNHLKQIMYNPENGASYDGLEDKHININQGAESTLCYFKARLIMEKYT